MVAEQNIVSVQNKVGTNYIYDYEHGMTASTTQSGITFTWKDNDKLNIKATGVNTSEVYYNLEVDIGSKYVGKILSCVGCNSYVKLYISQTSGSSAVSTQGDDIVIPSNATNRLFVAVYANAPSFDIDVEPMIRDSIITSNTYSAPALSNSDLTVLASEDRASLAEVVDSGAKNLIDLADKTITISGYAYDKTTIPSLPKGNYACSIARTNTVASMQVALWDSNNNEVGRFNPDDNYFTTTGTATKITIWVNLVGGSSSGTISNIMICTKAAFGVSSKFVPYRPNWDLVASAIVRSSNHCLKKMVSFSTSVANTYEIITNSKITVPANKMIRIAATGMWRNSYCTGIKIQIGNDLRDNRTLAINETTTAYNGLPVIATYYNDNTNDIDLYVAARTDNTTASMLVIIYDIV